MTRDNDDRLQMFSGADGDVEIIRVALNMDQVRQYNPPPNPAKITDRRFASYERKFGNESWELDALDPRTIDEIISKEIDKYIDFDKWEEAKRREKNMRKRLQTVASEFKEKEF